ncbi:MAG: selenium-dependent molybdenum cofactor biosynthesis protein YqeB [Desulfomonilaceae bacterium]
MTSKTHTKPLILSDLKIVIRGAGEMATGCACRLYNSGFYRIVMTEIEEPLAVRRAVSLCEAVYEKSWTVEGVQAQLVDKLEQIYELWERKTIPVMVDPPVSCLSDLKSDVLIDAILAKKNTGISMASAPLVIALGPGFLAGKDAHYVIETARGHQLGRLILDGYSIPNTGIPGEIAGQSVLRVLRAPMEGIFLSDLTIGTLVEEGEVVGHVCDEPVTTRLSGVLRGLIRPGIYVTPNLKIGDVDPRGDSSYCTTISEKARAIGGSVLEAILRTYNKTH